MIRDKCDQDSVDSIINQGYPVNSEALDELLSWTCDPNWPIAASIYGYFVRLGEKEVQRVLSLADRADESWRYSLITNLIAQYSDAIVEMCTDHLQRWAKQPGSDECDFESLRVLSERKLLSDAEIKEIAHKNVQTYQLWIEETLQVCDVSGE